ncbi:MAG: carbohydrate kinase family protein [Candidatus Pacearchaeota archaeon]
MNSYDVISFGSGVVDAFLDCDFKEQNGKIIFPVGTKISIKNIEFSTGGGGTNTAACFSYLGLKTGFIGKVASGGNSHIILTQLKNYKVDFLGVKSKDKREHSGYSIILLSNKKNRTILTYKGVSDNLSKNEINFKKLKTKWIHFSSMAGKSFETQKEVIDYCMKNKIKISFNPSSYQTKFGVKHLSKFLKNSYIISMNKEEAEMLVRKDLTKNLHKLGAKIIVITNGSNQGEVFDGKFLYKYYPNYVNIKGSTGAGDVFIASLVSGFIKTSDIKTSIKIAMANSESVIQKQGAKEGLLSWEEVIKRIKTRNYKIKIIKT